MIDPAQLEVQRKALVARGVGFLPLSEPVAPPVEVVAPEKPPEPKRPPHGTVHKTRCTCSRSRGKPDHVECQDCKATRLRVEAATRKLVARGIVWGGSGT